VDPFPNFESASNDYTSPVPQPPTGEVGAGGASAVGPSGEGGHEGAASIPVVSLKDLDESGRIAAIKELLGGVKRKVPAGQGGATGHEYVDEPARTETVHYTFTVAEAWESFGPRIHQIAEQDPELFQQSTSHLEDIGQVRQLRQLFPQATKAIALENLQHSKKLAAAELERLAKAPSGKETSEAEQEAQRRYMEQVRAAVQALQLGKQALEGLRNAEVYDTEAIRQGVTGSSHPSNSIVRFDPLAPHADYTADVATELAAAKGSSGGADVPLYSADPLMGGTCESSSASVCKTQEPELQVPGTDLAPDQTHNWSSVKSEWDRLTDALADLGNEYPTAFAVEALGKGEDLLKTTDNESGANIAVLALTELKQNIDLTFSRLKNGDLSWTGLEAIQKRLMQGPGWSRPVAKFAAETELAEAGGVSTLEAVGVPLAVLGLVVFGAVTLGTGFAMLGIAAAGGAAIEGVGKLNEAAMLDTAKESAASPKYSLTEQGGDPARIESVMLLAMAALSVVDVPASLGGSWSSVFKRLSSVRQGAGRTPAFSKALSEADAAIQSGDRAAARSALKRMESHVRQEADDDLLRWLATHEPTPLQAERELRIALRGSPQRIQDGEYVLEFRLTNTHSWKISRDGVACRFSADPKFCRQIVRLYRQRPPLDVEEKYIADPRLVVDMPYVGKGQPGTNAAGWARDSQVYWNEIMRRHPEAFSDANRRILAGDVPGATSPVNDEQFRTVFRQYDVRGLRGLPLRHHHVGGGGQAFGIPEPLHRGFGGVHNVEKEMGIWGGDDEVAELLERLLRGS
jgi:hypothetical protein